MALIIKFSEEKMFTQVDFDMNSVQRNTGSLKEAFKQTILNQEVIFRKQVHELHRLYSVQITLMKDLGCKEFGRYNSWNECTQSSLAPHTNAIIYESQQKEPRISTNSTVGSLPPISQELLKGCQGTHYNLQQMPFDLQAHANLYIGGVHNDFPDKSNASNHFKNTLGSHVNNLSDAIDLTLSLSLEAGYRIREGVKRSWLDKEIQTSPQFVIDLEDSSERTLRENKEQESSLGYTDVNNYIEGKDESQVSVLSNLTITRSVTKDKSREIVVSSFLVDDGECCQERHSSNQETKDCQAVIPCNYMSIKQQQKLTSYDVRHLDLNEVQLDDLHCNLSDPVVANPSAARSLGVFPEMVDRDKLSGTDEAELVPAALKSISRLPMDLNEYHGSCYSDRNNRDTLTSELHGGLLNDLNHTGLAPRLVSCEKSGVEDAEHAGSGQSQDKHGNEFAASCKSCCIVDNASSSTKTLRSGIESGNSSIPAVGQFSGTQVQSQAADILSGEQDRISCGNIEHGCIKKKEESSEVDVSIQRAAESLIHISLENSVCFQDSSTRSGSNERENDDTEQPQKSSDSFELITLKLREGSSDDYCVSSKPFEVDDSDKRDFGIKLRRGTRLKDFQKEILPSLASLSRYEICEDINILEGVLRSKEYRKNRGRIGEGESWCLPTRSKRKRLNNLQRRNFS